MCTKSELNRILIRLAEAYKSVYGKQLVKILLYGSYARGEYTEDSDIDVVALVQGERLALQNKLQEIWDISSEMELEYGTILSPTVIPYDEYLRFVDDLPYYRNIANEGVEISA